MSCMEIISNNQIAQCGNWRMSWFLKFGDNNFGGLKISKALIFDKFRGLEFRIDWILAVKFAETLKKSKFRITKNVKNSDTWGYFFAKIDLAEKLLKISTLWEDFKTLKIMYQILISCISIPWALCLN